MHRKNKKIGCNFNEPYCQNQQSWQNHRQPALKFQIHQVSLVPEEKLI